jgi:molecular chaperone GrpE
VAEEMKEEAAVEPINDEAAGPAGTEAEADAPISVPSEEWVALQAELEEARAKAAENLDGWQRALAEFSNYKKRLEREKETVHQTALGKVVLHYLAVVDDLELALENRPISEEGATWAEGIDLILRKLQTFLEAEGVKAIEAVGEEFDPTLHEAIVMEPSEDYESGQVIGVVQTGYKMGDRILRPAKVRVAQ